MRSAEYHRRPACTSLREVKGYLQQGGVSLCFIGGAEVDVHATSTPRKRAAAAPPAGQRRGRGHRLAGRPGGHIMAHEKRRLVRQVQYMTSRDMATGRAGAKDASPEAALRP